jgi:Tol biopolymer transport system component
MHDHGRCRLPRRGEQKKDPMTRFSLRPRRLAELALSLLLLVICAGRAPAQYFGRNKVQYRSFDFHVMKTPHFDIYFYPEEEAATRDAARMAERWYSRLSRVLDHEFTQRQPVILYASHPDFQQTTTLSGDIGEGTGGVTEAYKQRVVLPFAYSYEETDHVLGHELVHAFQYDISGLGRAGGGLEAAARRFDVPGWFVEGMAEYLSVGPVDPLTAIWLRNAALSGDIPTIDQLSHDPRIFPYRYGQALWAYIGGRWGDATIGQILELAGEGVPYEETFQQVLNISLDDLSSDWQASIRRSYLPQLATRREAREVARPLITNTREGGRLNVAPVLSPDGRWVVFLSELNFIDVELHLANAQTGRVIRTLQKGSAFDPHFGSLRYINSAGAWSPDSKRFAFGALRDSHDVLVLLDVDQGSRLREYAVDGVGEITSPSWSPDGQTIVFSGQAGGTTDLYALDLRSGDARKLTDDRFADLQPAFSPDGKRLAFVTDRFGTRFDGLTYGPYQLATLELDSKEIRPVPEMMGPHNINPQWTRDGAGLFFISNRSGIPNVYRVELASGALSQVTNIYSGVSGITDLSPALTVATGSDRLLFTAFESKGYNIYSISNPRELAGTPVPASDSASVLAAVLPPLPRPTEPAFNRVATLLADYTTGLPAVEAASAYPVVSYHAKLGLDYLGQPQVGVAAGGVFGGVGVSGGIAGVFSDVLGRHTLAGVVQAQGQWDEIGGALQYLNSSRRLNYGLAVQRIPYIYGYYAAGVDPADPTVYRQQIVRQRFFDTSVQGYAWYPVSPVQRFELSGGPRRVSQDSRIYEVAYAANGAYQTSNRKVAGYGYNMVEGSAAWVYDSAIFGNTAPMAGQRARLDVSPVVGQLQYTGILADYRHYFFARPFTLAVRGLHYGRYGRDSEGVLSPIYLGYSSFLRGYESVYGNCYNNGADCAVVNSLFGSRVAVGSAELRLPLAGVVQLANGLGLPLDAHVFSDVGTAWTAATRPTLNRGAQTDTAVRGLLTSVGGGLRTNLFGYAVLEVDYVNAMESARGWHWVIALQPGF